MFTAYGLLVSGKVAALMVLGLIGWLHRRSSVAAVVEQGDRRAIMRSVASRCWSCSRRSAWRWH